MNNNIREAITAAVWFALLTTWTFACMTFGASVLIYWIGMGLCAILSGILWASLPEMLYRHRMRRRWRSLRRARLRATATRPRIKAGSVWLTVVRDEQLRRRWLP